MSAVASAAAGPASPSSDLDAREEEIKRLRAEREQQLRDALRERNEQLRTAAEALAQLRKDFDFNLEVVRARDREIAALDEEVQELRSDMQANARLLSEARLAVSHADAQLWSARQGAAEEVQALRSQLAALAGQMEHERAAAVQEQLRLQEAAAAEGRRLRARIAELEDESARQHEALSARFGEEMARRESDARVRALAAEQRAEQADSRARQLAAEVEGLRGRAREMAGRATDAERRAREAEAETAATRFEASEAARRAEDALREGQEQVRASEEARRSLESDLRKALGEERQRSAALSREVEGARAAAAKAEARARAAEEERERAGRAAAEAAAAMGEAMRGEVAERAAEAESLRERLWEREQEVGSLMQQCSLHQSLCEAKERAAEEAAEEARRAEERAREAQRQAVTLRLQLEEARSVAAEAESRASAAGEVARRAQLRAEGAEMAAMAAPAHATPSPARPATSPPVAPERASLAGQPPGSQPSATHRADGSPCRPLQHGGQVRPLAVAGRDDAGLPVGEVHVGAVQEVRASGDSWPAGCHPGTSMEDSLASASSLRSLPASPGIDSHGPPWAPTPSRLQPGHHAHDASPAAHAHVEDRTGRPGVAGMGTGRQSWDMGQAGALHGGDSEGGQARGSWAEEEGPSSGVREVFLAYQEAAADLGRAREENARLRSAVTMMREEMESLLMAQRGREGETRGADNNAGLSMGETASVLLGKLARLQQRNAQLKQENARLLELSVEARAEVLALQEELEEAREGVEGVAREVAETRRLGGGQANEAEASRGPASAQPRMEARFDDDRGLREVGGDAAHDAATAALLRAAGARGPQLTRPSRNARRRAEVARTVHPRAEPEGGAAAQARAEAGRRGRDGAGDAWAGEGARQAAWGAAPSGTAVDAAQDPRPSFRAPSGRPKDLYMEPGDYVKPGDRDSPEMRRSLEMQRQGGPLAAAQTRASIDAARRSLSHGLALALRAFTTHAHSGFQNGPGASDLANVADAEGTGGGFAAFPSDPYWAAGGAASDPEGLARRRGGYGGMDGEGDHTGGDGEGAESDGPWAGVAGAGIGLEERAPRTATASSRYSESQRRKLRQLAERRARQRSGQGWGRGRGMEGLVSVETLERMRRSSVLSSRAPSRGRGMLGAERKAPGPHWTP